MLKIVIFLKISMDLLHVLLGDFWSL